MNTLEKRKELTADEFAKIARSVAPHDSVFVGITDGNKKTPRLAAGLPSSAPNAQSR